MLIFALAMAVPTPLTEIHQRDIGCVAALGLVANEQQRGIKLNEAFPDVRETGKRWTAIVGQRIMAETGQPRELVAFAITEAVKAQQDPAHATLEPGRSVKARFDACVSLMQAELAETDAASLPLPKPVSAQ